MISYSEYIQAKKMVKRNTNYFVRKIMRKTITGYKIQLRAENNYIKH